MMTQETEKVRKQMQIVCIDDLVPKDHLLRLIDKAIDWTFIYDLVRDLIPTEWVDQVLIPLRLLRYLLFNTCMESKACGRQSKRLK